VVSFLPIFDRKSGDPTFCAEPMTPERYRKIGDLFDAALEMAPADRAAFLDKQCGNDLELRREVESLIASSNEAFDFIGNPALAVAAELLASDETDELIGKTIGRYVVRSLLGVGGMGRVYLAEDVELGRRVALKVLLKHFTYEKTQLQRFRQEARAASALNHPNILTVYEIGQVDDTHFIATEYVEGETLRDHPHHSAITLGEAINIATQVADALAAAHAAGIVHRDIKPENVMLRRDGYVKVLDFGLAKLTERVSGLEGGLSDQSMREMVRTDSGVIMGTVYYMSPEQIRGAGVDARTDVWSLGVLLYELVAHRRPFEEETQGDTIVSILEGEPPLLTGISDIPAELQGILTKALTTNIDERYQMAQELAKDLRQLRRKLEVDSPIALTGAIAAASSTGDRKHAQTGLVQFAKSTSSLEFAVNEIKRHKTSVALAGVLFVAALAGVSFGLFKFFGRAQPARPTEPLKVIPLTTLPGKELNPAFSPDGKQVAFVWTGEQDDNFDIYVKLIGVGEPLRLTNNLVHEMSPAWSPDGRYIAFLRGTGEGKGFYLVPALGGAERKLSDAYGWTQGGVMSQAVAWSPDGRTLALVDKAAEDEPWCIYLLSLETGERRKFTTPPAQTDGDTTVAFSPDGRTLAFVRSHNLVGDVDSYLAPGDIYLAPVAGGDPVRLTFGEKTINGLAWTPDGKELVLSLEPGESGRPILWRIPAAGGTPAPVVERPGDAVFDPSVSRQGNRLAFAQMSYDFNIYRVEVTDQPGGRRKAGTPATLISSTRTESDPRFSPDGRRVVFISNRSGNSNMWVCDADGKNPAQLTDGIYVDMPSWSPDGRLVAFNSVAGGNSDIYAIGADAGAVRRLTTDPSAETSPSWSPDGSWLYFSSNRTGRAEVWRMPVAGGAAVQLTHGGGFNPVAARDGRTVYYLHGEKEAWLWSVSTEGGAETPVMGNAEQGKWMEPGNWAVAERGIYFLEGKLGVGYLLEFFDLETSRTTPLATLGGPCRRFPMIGLTVAPTSAPFSTRSATNSTSISC
jgi:eukaryotic-like serine/threonine-protein kinase